jgi:ADP-heptose:LPS heptosyltransferase
MSHQVRILVLRGGAIGDFIVTIPALQALRAHWPDAYIELAGYPHVAQLAIAGGLVNKVVSLDAARMARFFALRPAFDEEQAAYVRGFDFIVSYLHDPDGSVQENLRAAGSPQVIYGSPIVKEGHAADHMMQALAGLAIYDDAPVPRVALDSATRARGRAILDALSAGPRPLAIHPGSGSPRKNWPLDRFVQIARERGAAAVLVAGEADRPLLDALRAGAPGIPLICDQPLIDVAGALAHCAGFLGNDSGLTHLAAALGLPVVALFGPTDPSTWGPRGPYVRILRAKDHRLASVTLDEVRAALRNLGLADGPN